MSKVKHLHKYKRDKLGNSYMIMRCVLPGCSHYIGLSLAEGKLCECNRCGDPMILNKRALRLTKPHCEACVAHKEEKEYEDINFDEILNS